MAVISYGLWQRRFGGSPDVLGRKIILNDSPYEVIGVMPREFYFMPARDIDIWMPTSFSAEHADAILVARRALRRAAQARRHAPAGQGIDGGIESACVGATCQTSARGSGDAVAGGIGGQDANVADRAAGRVGGGPADRVRQSGEFADVARGGASPRSGGACGARRRTRQIDHAVSDREPGARGIRRHRRTRARHTGHAVSGNAGAGDHGRRAADSRLARAGVFRGDRHRRRIDVWTCARSRLVAARLAGRTARRRPRQFRRAQPSVPTFAHRHRDGSRRRAADERRIAAADVSTSAAARSRNPQRQAADLCHAAVPLSRLRPARGLRQRGVGKDPRDSRRHQRRRDFANSTDGKSTRSTFYIFSRASPTTRPANRSRSRAS